MKRDTNPTTISRFFQAKRARPQTDERPGKSTRAASSKAAAAPKLQRQTVEREEPAPVRTLRTCAPARGVSHFTKTPPSARIGETRHSHARALGIHAGIENLQAAAGVVKAEVKEEEEAVVPCAETTVPASVAAAIEQDVLAIARLNAELRATHADRPRVKAERAACLQRIRATMTALHPEVRALAQPLCPHQLRALSPSVATCSPADCGAAGMPPVSVRSHRYTHTDISSRREHRLRHTSLPAPSPAPSHTIRSTGQAAATSTAYGRREFRTTPTDPRAGSFIAYAHVQAHTRLNTDRDWRCCTVFPGCLTTLDYSPQLEPWPSLAHSLTESRPHPHTHTPHPINQAAHEAPREGTRAATNAAVEAQVERVVAAGRLLRSSPENRQTAAAARDAALDAVRRTMAALHPKTPTEDLSQEHQVSHSSSGTRPGCHAWLPPEGRYRACGRGSTRPAGLPHPWGATSCCKVAPLT